MKTSIRRQSKRLPRTVQNSSGWLLFFYSVPSKPVSNRMTVWRKLVKVGAVHLKESVYILPDNEEHYEFLQWLVSEVSGMKGEGAFVRIKQIETIMDSEIIAMFDEQREHNYAILQKSADDFASKMSSIRKGTSLQNLKSLTGTLAKLLKSFEEISNIDFFNCKAGVRLGEAIGRLKTELDNLAGSSTKKTSPVAARNTTEYQRKFWVTRRKPFVDRMASAWLIRKFIDSKASFEFIEEEDLNTLSKNSIAFDIRGGEFTHSGDMCTFEVLVKAFKLKDKALKKMAEIVHDLDMKDDKYKAKEAKGLENILVGIKKSTTNDQDALDKGMAVFEMIYVSKNS